MMVFMDSPTPIGQVTAATENPKVHMFSETATQPSRGNPRNRISWRSQLWKRNTWPSLKPQGKASGSDNFTAISQNPSKTRRLGYYASTMMHSARRLQQYWNT